MKYLLSILLILALGVAVISCKSTGDSSATKTEVTETTPDQTNRAYTAMYFCQMYCEGSGDDKPGKCPVCQIDYQLNVAALGGPPPGTDGYIPNDHDNDGIPDY